MISVRERSVSRRSLNASRVPALLGLALLWATPSFGRAQEFDEGFIEPFRTIDVACEEAGIVEAVPVQEGQAVAAGGTLCQLQSRMQRKLLAIAEQNMQSVGRTQVAEAELELRESRRALLERLLADGHARPEEVRRARAEADIASANLLAAREEAVARQLEYERVRVAIERRTVTAPTSGVVLRVHKEVGEFVSPGDPVVVTLVQLDRLLANFTIPSEEVDRFSLRQRLRVRIGDGRRVAAGLVHALSPVTDAESGTVLMKVLIENPEGKYRAGERCSLEQTD